MARLVLLLLFVGLGTPIARADGTAQSHHEAGLRFYNLSEWEAALKEFRAAYILKPDPTFLFNIGQCQRQLGQFDSAEKSYRAYLREATDVPPAQAEQVRRLIAQMAEAVREARLRQPPTGASPSEPVPIALVVAPAPAPPLARPVPVYKKWWLWTAVGAVVVVGVGVGLGVGLTQGTHYPEGGPANAVLSF